MSNSNINNDLSGESRTSFVTISSMISSMDINNNPQKDNEEINLNSLNKNSNYNIPNSTSKNFSSDPLSNESLMAISMSQEEDNLNLKKNNSSSSDKFQDLPLQYSISEKRNKNVIPHLIVEDKGEKRD
jgi:hypothetical protein